MSATPLDLMARFGADSDDRVAFELLEEHLFMEADWPALADLYRRRQAAPSLTRQTRARAELALRLGQLHEERLAAPEAAIAAYTEAVRLDPKLRRALQHLRRLYAARRSWAAVLQICEQQLEQAGSGDERARIYAEMGDIWQRELADPKHAALLYERARADSGGPPAPDAQVSPDAERADAPLVQSAWLAAARGDVDAALDGLRRALERNPADVDALDLMLSVLEGAERPREIARLLERRASLAEDAETRSAVLVRLGAIREELGDLGEARESYERAVEAQPDHAGARATLARLYRRIEAWSALRGLLEQELESASGAARVDLLCELAALLQGQLDDPDAAHERFEEALALDPADPRAAAALAPSGGEHAALTMPDLEAEPTGAEQRSTRIVDVLERKLAHREARGAERSPEARRLRLRIAELRSGALGEPAAAVATLEPLLADADALIEAAPMLAGLYEQLGRMPELMDLAERTADLAPAPEERVFWLRRAAEAARAAGDPECAIGAYRRLLDESPRDRGARAALCELHRSRGEAEPLLALLREELPRADESREFEIQLELASLMAEHLEDEQGAIAHLRRCLELEPQRSDLLEWALQACDRRGGPLAQLDLVEHVAQRAAGAGARAALLARRGVLLADALDWRDEAIESWRSALAMDPEQPLARERLDAAGSA